MTTKYLIHMIVAALTCLGISIFFSIKGQVVNYIAVFLAYAYGVVFLSTVVIKLPVFKDYYNKDNNSIEEKPWSRAERKSAPVMSSIVTVLSFGAIIYIAGISNAGVPIICSGITAGIMSYYFDKNF